mmetsp:Transcript_33860/g.51934  ORF Transcript_33860/g.51934 Transcript_33860/m.51934 type:complete len:227 (+) Transcript_33860:1-681(+)
MRLRCVTPWSIIMVLLRNPISRAYSNYHYAKQRRYFDYSFSFAEAVAQDIDKLKVAGVLDDPYDNESWTKYLNANAATRWRLCFVGRGLYAIQLRQWFEAYEQELSTTSSRRTTQTSHLPKKPDHFLIMPSENVHSNPKKSMNEIFDFLSLDKHEMDDNSFERKPSNSGHYYTSISKREIPEGMDARIQADDEVKRKLEKFFAPFNDELVEMLGEEWKDIWKSKQH